MVPPLASDGLKIAPMAASAVGGAPPPPPVPPLPPPPQAERPTATTAPIAVAMNTRFLMYDTFSCVPAGGSARRASREGRGSAGSGIQRVAQAVAEQVEGQHCHED